MGNLSLTHMSIAGLIALMATGAACNSHPLLPSGRAFGTSTPSDPPNMPPTGPPPTVTTVTPAIGATGGRNVVKIAGSEIRSGATVTFDGLPTRYAGRGAYLFGDTLYLEAPAHAAGPVTIVVRNPDGQTATVADGYTYVEPESLDPNGDWQGGTGYDWQTPVRFTIQDNAVVSASCADVPIPLSEPSPLSRGEFTLVSKGVVVMTGRMLAENAADGTISTGPCGSDYWVANKSDSIDSAVTPPALRTSRSRRLGHPGGR